MTTTSMCVRSELRSRWISWVAAALVIGTAAAIGLTAAAGARRTSSAYTRLLAVSHSADLLVSPNATGFPGFYPALARSHGVALVAPVIGYGGVDVSRPGTPVLMQAGTDGAFGFRVERPKITAGRMLVPDRPGEVVADRTAARVLHLHPGSRLHIAIARSDEELPDRSKDPTVALKVVGIGVTRDNVVLDNALASAPTLLVGPDFARRFGAGYHAFDGAEVVARPGVSKARLSAQARSLARRFPETGGGLFVADEAEQAAKVQHAIRPQAVALGLFALLSAITAIFAVGQVVSRQVAASALDSATLRSLGMTRSQIARARLVVVGLAATVGALVGIGLAVIASSWMPIGPARIAEPSPGVDWDWLVLGGGGLAIVALTVAGATWPIWRSARSLDRAAAAHTVRPSRLAGMAFRAGVPVSTTVGIGHALDSGGGRRSVPVRSAAVGLSVAVAAITGALVFGASLSDLVHTPRRYGQTWDVTADAQFSPIPAGRIDRRLRTERGVTAWTFGTHGEVQLGRHRVPSVQLARGRGALLAPTVVDGRAASATREIVLGTKTMDAVDAHVGDSILVASEGGTPRAEPMRVVGRSVFPFFGQGSFSPTGLGVGAETAQRPPSLAGSNFVLVRVAPGSDHDATVARVAHDLVHSDLCGLDNQCQVTTSSRPVDILNYARVQATPIVLATVLAFLGVLVLAYLLMTSLRYRRHDFAVYKSLGFTRRQLSSTVAAQATTVVMIALIIGLPVGVVTGRVAWTAFTGNLGLPHELTVPGVALIVTAAGALLAANAVAAGPGFAAGRRHAASLMRTE